MVEKEADTAVTSHHRFQYSAEDSQNVTFGKDQGAF
jgi:hypothetical protein